MQACHRIRHARKTSSIAVTINQSPVYSTGGGISEEWLTRLASWVICGCGSNSFSIVKGTVPRQNGGACHQPNQASQRISTPEREQTAEEKSHAAYVKRKIDYTKNDVSG